jgi:hypothetical protein
VFLASQIWSASRSDDEFSHLLELLVLHTIVRPLNRADRLDPGQTISGDARLMFELGGTLNRKIKLHFLCGFFFFAPSLAIVVSLVSLIGLLFAVGRFKGFEQEHVLAEEIFANRHASSEMQIFVAMYLSGVLIESEHRYWMSKVKVLE